VSASKRLTARERRLLLAHIAGASLTEAYLQLKPDVDRVSAANLGSRMLKRILTKAPWEQLLRDAGLGDDRLMRELEARLTAMETKIWQGKPVGDFVDNATRMRATELLAEMLGHQKAELTLHHDTITIIPAPKSEDHSGDVD
jgi:hypothetical protein